MRPGTYQMTDLQYHSDPCPEPSLSSSAAKVLLSHSPLHANSQHVRLNPGYVRDECARFDLGSAAHAVLIENDWSGICVIDPADHAGKKGAIPKGWTNDSIRKARDEARAQGLIPMLHEDSLIVRQMVIEATTYLARTELNGIFQNGLPEQTIVWQESIRNTPIWLRARLDWLTLDQDIILDYKTCASASPNAFQRQIANMGYDIQAAFYRRGVAAIGGDEDALFVFLAQEIEPPYACSLHTLSPEFMAMADDKVQRAVDLWASCMRAGHWPAYPTTICRAEPPAWALNQHLDNMEELPRNIFAKEPSSAF